MKLWIRVSWSELDGHASPTWEPNKTMVSEKLFSLP